MGEREGGGGEELEGEGGVLTVLPARAQPCARPLCRPWNLALIWKRQVVVVVW